jgi:hypothetical protein
MMTAEGVAHDSDHGTFALHEFSQIQISNSRTLSESQLRDLAAHFRASFTLSVAPSKIRGRRECRALDAPAASHAK